MRLALSDNEAEGISCAMIYFVVFASFLVGPLVPVHADEVEINGPECGISPSTTLIVNGSIAKENQFPWMVFVKILIRDDDGYLCGGSIFTSRHVLTAAHCLSWKNIEPTVIEIEYGASDRRLAKMGKVKKWIRHPNYREREYDIAVLVMETPFKFTSSVKPVCIPSVPKDNYYADAIIAGWGNVKYDDFSLQNRLSFTTVNILPNERCSKVYGGYYDKKVMYCAYEEGTDACWRDEGGPLIVPNVGLRFVQVGIYSIGRGCAAHDAPSLYTRVDAFVPWLKQVVHSLNSSDKAYSEQVPLRLASYTVPQWPFFTVPL